METFDSHGWWTGAINYGSDDYHSPNYTPGNNGRRAVVLHVTDGTDSRGWLCNPRSGVSSTFLIREEGIYQLVSIHNTAYANGLTYSKDGKCWIDPAGNRVSPPWPGLTPPINPNFTTISIEREGRPRVAMSAAIDAMTVRLLQALASVYGQFRPYTPGDTLIGHRDIGPKHRANCPGPLVDFQRLANAANAALPDHGAGLTRRVRVKAGIDYAQVRQDRRVDAPEATIHGVSVRLAPGTVIEIGDVTNGWGWLLSGIGFVKMTLLEAV